jgi:hypothetical protein
VKTGKVAIFGRIHRQEFRQLFRDRLAEYQLGGTPVVLLNETDTLDNETALPFDECLFFQSYPYEFSEKLLTKCRQVPCRFYLGACCEGMFRTGKVPAALNRQKANWKYVHEIQGRQNDSVNTKISQVCIVNKFGPFGNDPARNQYLADYWQSQGYEIVTEEMRTSAPVLIVADADDAPQKTIQRYFSSLRAKFDDNEYAVYINSPRINEINALCGNSKDVRVIDKL